MLEIKKLNVEIENKKIIDNLDLKLEKGKIYVLMGPNGSGKSTIANAIIGNPKYKTSGKILLNKRDVSKMKTNERAEKGIFISYQNPTEVPGVTIYNFLRTAMNSGKRKKLSMLEFQKILEEKSSYLGLDIKFLTRYINENFSGGEKKKSEILQMLMLNPKIVILDEIDSGLDSDSLKEISKAIKNFSGREKTILIITHYKKILDYINPEKVFVISNGKIVKEGKKDLISKIEKKGYSWIKKNGS